MTVKERKNPKLLKQASRKKRIMEGSGRSAQEYNKAFKWLWSDVKKYDWNG